MGFPTALNLSLEASFLAKGNALLEWPAPDLIACILGSCSFPQIDDAVVTADTVDVVKMLLWPSAICIEPGKAMT
jgi:hypothetical protein